MVTVAVSYTAPELLDRSEQLAQQLHLPLHPQAQAGDDFLLEVTPERLQLVALTLPGVKPIYVDFLGGKMGYRQAHRRLELLVKACGVKSAFKPYVIDATAGLGQDAMVLAQHGCRVLMLERNKIIASLLADGLRRWREHAAADKVQLQLKSVVSEDCLAFLSVEEQPDVVYLDPMFPKREKSALVKKEMRLLHSIVGDATDINTLFTAALRACKKRVVVKRPLHAPWLLNQKPGAVYPGRSTRFDVYFL